MIRAATAGLVLAAVLAAIPCGARAQGMLMTIVITNDHPNPRRPEGKVNTLQEVMRAIGACWQFPPVDEGHGPVDPIFQVSFKRSGELFGKPRVIKFSREVSPQERERFYQAAVEAIDRCSPMPFTDSMGGAIAGRTLQIRIIDSRKQKRAGRQWLTTKG